MRKNETQPPIGEDRRPGIFRNACVLLSLVLATVSAQAVKFRLPLSSDTAVHYYYDHNTSSGVTAWNCGGNSYNGHQGNDFSGGPRGRAIFASANGTLNYKIDRFGDGHLGSADGGGAGNHVRIDHGGGVITWYMHMTIGSVTGKGVGSAMACSEQIGGVGTSGSSTGLHLHFDLRINGARRDPFIGSCGGLGYWVNQGSGSPSTACESVSSGAYYFGTGTDGWILGNGLTALGWSASGWPGIIYADQIGNDAYFLSPAASFSVGTAPCVSVNVYPQAGSSANHNMQIFWTTAAEPYFDAAKSSGVVSYTAQNAWMRLNLGVNSPKWVGHTITRLRLDVDNGNTGTRWIFNDVIAQNTMATYWFDANTQGWAAGNGFCCGLGWADNGYGGFFGDQNGNDAFVYSPGGLAYLGGQNDVLRVRVYPQSGNTAIHDMQVFWISAGEAYNATKSSVVVNYTAQNGWIDVVIPVGANPNWVSWIDQIRLDFDQTNHGNRWIVDYVMIEHQNAPVTP